MGMVMIKCPRTGRPVSTGIQAERATFHSTPVFFSHMYCSICQTTHQWFPDDDNGETVEAPTGPGIYQVRHSTSRRVVAFGSANNVTRALATLFRLQKPPPPRILGFEYRACPAASHADAMITARRLFGPQKAKRRRSKRISRESRARRAPARGAPAR